VAFLEKFCHLDHGPAKKFVFFFENKKNTNSIEIFFWGVQLPNYLGAVPGTGRKTLRYIQYGIILCKMRGKFQLF
jgi:hypothetical protein